MSSTQDEQEVDDTTALDDKTVIEPTENDVLCGRGGMSNHHPGNEWYRRLIRSNRPLYRACPKHTKLLVSKAIVQAVEEQHGRFLERSRKTGMWYKVPYKRAVDKTSQGLRERDKEGDEITPGASFAGGIGKLNASGRGGATVTVPNSLLSTNGSKPPKPNLKALAKVTMAHAGFDPTPSVVAPPPLSVKPTAITTHPSPQQQRTGMTQTTSLPKVTQPIAEQTAVTQRQQRPSQQLNAPSLLKQQQQQAQQQVEEEDDELGPPVLEFTRSQRQSSMFGFFLKSSDNNNDLDPLPPALNSGQSALFRLFNAGGLFRGESSTISNSNAPTEQTLQQQQAPGFSSNATAFNNNNNRNMLPGSYDGNSASLGQQDDSSGNDAPPPAFNRLTTQVSDWLNSFWPLPQANNNHGKADDKQHHQQRQQQFLRLQEQQRQQQQRNLLNDTSMDQFAPTSSASIDSLRLASTSQQQQQQQSMFNALPTSSQSLLQNTSRNSMQAGGRQSSANDVANTMENAMNNVRMNSFGNMNSSTSTSYMRQQQLYQQQSNPSGMVTSSISNNDNAPKKRPISSISDMDDMDDMDDIDDDIDMSSSAVSGSGGMSSSVPLPTALEHSVSASLLKLASTPSSIIAGLSTFFKRDSSSGQQQQQQQQQPEINQLPFPRQFSNNTSAGYSNPPSATLKDSMGSIVGSRRSSARRSSASLLDDYEETELEARLRSVP